MKKWKNFFVLFSLPILFACSTINKRDKMEDLELQLREIQRTNALLQTRVEELERKMYLLNLMQDKIESLSLKVDELSQRLKNHPQQNYVNIPRKNLRVSPSVESATTSVSRETEVAVSGGYGTSSGAEENEEPQPVNPRADLRGVDPSSPENIYRKAMSYLKAGDYDRASGLFLYLVQSFPDSDLADNALYWTGECYYATHNYSDAIEYFNKVLSQYPDGNKVPDAILKIGFSYLKMGNVEKGREYLKMVINNYPWSNPAKIARSKLKEINGGGE